MTGIFYNKSNLIMMYVLYDAAVCHVLTLRAWSSRAKGHGVVGLEGGRTREQGALGGLVVSVRVRVRAVALEVAVSCRQPQVEPAMRNGRCLLVVRDTARRARLGRVVRARAARGAVAGVGVDEARALAADRRAGGVERALERVRAARREVDGTVRDAAALCVLDLHGQVVAVDERDVVVVEPARRGA
jgi:hypothetical protein